MARKDLLKGLMTGDNAQSADPPPTPRRTDKGAIGAVSKSIADLKTRALTEVPVDLIDMAGFADRLDQDESGIAALADSIRDYGQQVPVLLRHSPNHEGRYEVVYGRRRVAALKLLGQPVRAMIRDLNDRDLIVAQGQENAARRDLSFIEKANFARQMVENGFERKVICDALHIDKTVISRMLSVVEAVPVKVIQAVGAAPSVGRDRWLALAERIGGRSVNDVTALARGDSSDARFAAVFSGLAPKKTPRPGPLTLKDKAGQPVAQVKRAGQKTILTFQQAQAQGFDDWLVKNFDRIHRDFLKERGE